MINTSGIILTGVVEAVINVQITKPPCETRKARTGKIVDGIMASSVVKTWFSQALIDFNLTVFTEVSTATVATEACMQVNTDAILRAVRVLTVIYTILAMHARKTYQTRTAVIGHQIRTCAVV